MSNFPILLEYLWDNDKEKKINQMEEFSEGY